MQWGEYIGIAEQLAAANTEAHHRSAVSRSYYAAYHAAKHFVADRDRAPGSWNYAPTESRDRRGVHEGLWLKLATPPEVASVMTMGLSLLKSRVWADYESADSGTHQARFSARYAQAAVLSAKEIIRRLGGAAKDSSLGSSSRT